MHIISRKRLNDFAELYPDTKTALESWYSIVKKENFENFNALRRLFPSADRVGKLTVFNIGGNKVRLIVAIHWTSCESVCFGHSRKRSASGICIFE